MYFTRIKVDCNIELRLLELRDAEELFALIDQNRTHLRSWLPWLDKTTEVKHSFEFIQYAQAQFSGNSAAIVGIWQQDQLVGIIAYNKIDWTNRVAYLGYWLSKHVSGQGIMTLACQALIQHAFKELKLNRIDIRCATENHKSCAIPKRLGFTCEGIIRDAEWLYDHYVDHQIWGLLAKDY